MVECAYKNPVSGEGCQLASVHHGKECLEYCGKYLCWWHLPIPDTKKVSAGVDMHVYHSRMTEYAKACATNQRPIDFSGIRFGKSPLDYIRYKKFEALVLDDVDIPGSLSITSQFNTNSIQIQQSVIRGDLSLATPLPNGGTIKRCLIAGSLEISYLVKTNIEITATVIKGDLSIAGNHRETLSGIKVERSVIGGGLMVPETIRLQVLQLVQCRIRKALKVHAKQGQVSIAAQGATVRGEADLHSQGPASVFDISGSHFPRRLRINGTWADIKIRAQTEISKLVFSSVNVTSWIATDSIFGSCSAEGSKASIKAVTISGCEFLDNVYFGGWHFGVFHCEARFRELLDLRNAVVVNELRFEPETSIAEFDISSTNNDDATKRLPASTFDEVVFGEARFNGRAFTSDASFRGTRFQSAPIFFGCRFQESFVFPMTVSSYASSGPLDEAKYRYLRQEMERLRARAYEGLFFALEQKSAFKSLDSTADKVVSWIYGGTSMYGTQLSRAMLSLLLVFLAFASWYSVALIAANPSSDLIQEAPTAIRIGLRQTFLPFFGLRADAAVGWYLAWVCQSVLSLAIIAEILVIIRWRFRRG